MEVLRDENVLPDAVQIGNEISSGMLWDLGKLPKDWDNDFSTDPSTLPTEWYNLRDFIQSGIDAVNSVVADRSEKPLIVLHLDTGGNQAYTEKWFKAYFSLKGTCDVIGLSWYPMWHGTFEDLRANINNLSIKFPQQQVWVVETAYYNSGCYCNKNDIKCRKTHPYPMDEQGQYNFLKKLRETLLSTRCRAVFYWGSHWSQPDKWFRSTEGEDWPDPTRRALFDKNGRALKGIRALVGM